MSKRFADAQGGSARYGGPEAPDAPDDPPRKATAAQLAKRSIKPLKGRSAASSRAASPSKSLGQPDNPFGAPPLQQPAFNSSAQSAFNPSTQSSFNASAFGQNFSQSTIAPPQASSFTFGATQPAAASNPFAALPQSQSFSGGFGASASQQNTSNIFSPAKTDFGFGGNTNSNGASTSFTFGGNTPSKPVEVNKPVTNSTPFSFGTNTPAKPAETNNTAPSTTQFSFGANTPAKPAEPIKPVANPPSFSFGTSTPAKPAEPNNPVASTPSFSFGANTSKPAESNHTPFSFGVTTPAKPSDTNKTVASTPSFSFGASTPSKPAETDKAITNGAPFSFGLNTPAKPAASSDSNTAATSTPFTFGASTSTQPAESNNAAPSTQFSFGGSTPFKPVESNKNVSTGAPFSFGATTSAKAAEPTKTTTASTSSFSAGTMNNSFGQSNSSNMFGQSQHQGISDAEIKEIEDAGPRLQQLGKFDGLVNIVRQHKDGDLAGLDLRELPADAQHKLLNYTRTSISKADPIVEKPTIQNVGTTPQTVQQAPVQPETVQPPPVQPAFAPASVKPSSAPTAFPAAPPAAPPAAFASVKPPSTPAALPAVRPAAPASAKPSGIPAATLSVKTTTSTPAAATKTSSAIVQKHRLLNEALRVHLASADPTQDWAPIMSHFLEQHAKIAEEARVDAIPDPTSKAPVTNGIAKPSAVIQTQAPATISSSSANKRKSDDEAGRDDLHKRTKAERESFASPKKPYSQTASLFNDILSTPEKQTASTSAQAPATAPAKAPVFAASTPTAPKVAAPPAETPKANPFASLTKVNNTPAPPPAATPKTVPPPATNPFQFKTSTPTEPVKSVEQSTASPSLFQSSTAAEPAKTASTPAPNSFQFKPSAATEPAKAAKTPAANPFKLNAPSTSTTSGTPAAPAFALPKFGAGGAGTTNFMSAFGATAAEQEKKDREKRKAEDFDSEDDDEEEWERKDAEEQAAKRKKIEEEARKASGFKFAPAAGENSGDSVFKPAATSAVKGPVFSFGGSKDLAPATTAPPPSASSNNIFGHLGNKATQDDDEEESDVDAEADVSATPAKPADSSLGKSLFDRIEKPSNDKSDDPPAASTFKFSGGSSSVFGDNTWKGASSTPIKFGTAKATDNDGTTTPDGSPAKPASSIFGTTGNASSTPKFGGFSATSIHDKPAAPQFGGLFGAKAPAEKTTPASPAAAGLNNSIFSPAGPKPTTSFTFGAKPSTSTSASSPAPAVATGLASSIFAKSTSAANSGATTPVTDAEGSGKDDSANEPSDEPKDTQVGDLTALTPEEAEKNDLLFESKAKASMFIKTPENGATKWQSRGLGMFRLLRNKESGRYQGIMRLIPGGKILLNFGLMDKGIKDAYVPAGKVLRAIIPDDAGGKLETWAIQFGTAEKVVELAGKIHEGQPEDDEE